MDRPSMGRIEPELVGANSQCVRIRALDQQQSARHQDSSRLAQREHKLVSIQMLENVNRRNRSPACVGLGANRVQKIAFDDIQSASTSCSSERGIMFHPSTLDPSFPKKETKLSAATAQIEDRSSVSETVEIRSKPMCDLGLWSPELPKQIGMDSGHCRSEVFL